jgi:hypothetical protein
MYKKAQSCSELIALSATRVDRRSFRVFRLTSPSRKKKKNMKIRASKTSTKARVWLVANNKPWTRMGICNLNPSVISAINTANAQLYPLPLFILKKYLPVGLSIKYKAKLTPKLFCSWWWLEKSQQSSQGSNSTRPVHSLSLWRPYRST